MDMMGPDPNPPAPMGGSSGAGPPGAPAANARYAYLVGRLRHRQITMEEATELFDLMQESMARSFNARQLPVPPAADAAADTEKRAPPPGAIPLSALGDDGVGLGLLALGVGTGLLAAVLKRSAEGPRPTRST